MPLIPQLSDLRERIRSRLTARIPALINAPENSIALNLADIIAGAMYESEQSIPGIARAAHPATATGQHLTDLAAVWSIQRKPDEDDDTLRNRLQDQIRTPLQTGTAADWEKWATALEGVDRAFAREIQSGVQIYLTNNTFTLELTEELEGRYREILNRNKPAGCELILSTPVATGIDVIITKITPDTADNRTELREALINIIREHAAPGGSIEPDILYQAACAIDITISTDFAGEVNPGENQIFNPTIILPGE